MITHQSFSNIPRKYGSGEDELGDRNFRGWKRIEPFEISTSHVKRRCSQTLPPFRQIFRLCIIGEVDGEEGGKIKYREGGKPVYLAARTFNPSALVYLFFHAFHRFFTHRRAPKAGVYHSVSLEHPRLPSFPLYSRARGCKPSLERATFLRVVIVRARSSHTLRRRVLCGGHWMPRHKIYDIAIRATIYIIKSLYPLPISTPFPFDRVTRYEATHFATFPSSSPRITPLRG